MSTSQATAGQTTVATSGSPRWLVVVGYVGAVLAPLILGVPIGAYVSSRHTGAGPNPGTRIMKTAVVVLLFNLLLFVALSSA
jgi:hypothetical protein